MRIIVTSDSHGDFRSLCSVAERHRSDADYFIFLGDGERELEDIGMLFPDLNILSVPGNNDRAFGQKITGELVAGGKTVFFTHGHMYRVKMEYDTIEAAARQRGADILLFGHTHRAMNLYRDGLYMVNPGSLVRSPDGRRSYAILDITKAGISVNIVVLR